MTFAPSARRWSMLFAPCAKGGEHALCFSHTLCKGCAHLKRFRIAKRNYILKAALL